MKYLNLFAFFSLILTILTAQVKNDNLQQFDTPISSRPKNFKIGQNNQVFLSSNKDLEELQLTNLIIASQVDGSLAGINRQTGETIWTLDLGSVVTSSSTILSNSSNHSSTIYDDNENIDNFQEFWAVEPFGDGSLYFFTKESGLNKIPFSVKDLILASPFSVDNDDKIFTGIRKSSMVYANVKTGKLLDSLSSKTCCGHKDSGTQCLDDCGSYITIGKTDYELVITSKSDNRAWKLSYTKYGENNLYNDLKLQHLNSRSVDGALVFPFQEKSLLSIDVNSNIPKWVTNLNSTCVNVFDVYVDQSIENYNKFVLVSHPIKPAQNEKLDMKFGGNNNKDDIGTYVGYINNNSWFAMSSENFPSLVKSSTLAKFQKNPNFYKPITDKEFLDAVVGVHKSKTSSNSRTISTTILSRDKTQNIISPIREKPTNGLMKRYQPNESNEEQQEPPLLIDPPKNEQSPRNSFLRLIFRLFENSIFTALLMAIVYYSSRAGLIPPLTTIMYKLGFMKRTAYAVEFAERILAESEVFNSNTDKKDNVVGSSSNKQNTDDPDHKFNIPLMNLEENGEEEIIAGNEIIESYDPKEFAQRLEQILNYEDEESNDEANNDITDVKKKLLDEIKEKRNLEENYNGKFDKTINQTVISNADEDDETEDVEEKREGKKLLQTLIKDETVPSILDADIVNTESNADIANADTIAAITTTSATKPQKKRKRGSRGGKSKKKNKEPKESKDAPKELLSNLDEEIINGNDVELVIKQPNRNDLGKSTLVISDDILGYGSHGTVVYKGTFENRPVAVKRMLIDFYDVANHEVKLLQESDDHPNVIRYFCSRQSDRFLYIALELCIANLEDLIEKKKTIQSVNYIDILYQMTSGLHHLHKLHIVHRDIKPQNILVTPSKTKDLRVLISDFGLCKKLEPDQSSFRGTTASGTMGWRAPELLENDNNSRITKMVDVFSLGLVFYYLLSNGDHPFGDKYCRESNILQSNYSLEKVSAKFNKSESKSLISKMIKSNPNDRISTKKILKHPFFWNSEKKIEFLLKVSDKLNILPRDCSIILEFEKGANQVFNNDWKPKFDPEFFANINTFRKYDSTKMMDLLRVIRNKYHHINEIPEEFGITEENFWDYFGGLFPEMIIYCYYFVEKNLRNDFESFY